MEQSLQIPKLIFKNRKFINKKSYRELCDKINVNIAFRNLPGWFQANMTTQTMVKYPVRNSNMHRWTTSKIKYQMSLNL